MSIIPPTNKRPDLPEMLLLDTFFVPSQEESSLIEEVAKESLTSLDEILNSISKKPVIPSRPQVGNFLVPDKVIKLANPFTFESVTYQFKVGPFYGETLESAQLAKNGLQKIAKSGYLGELLARKIVSLETKTGLVLLAESGCVLKNDLTSKAAYRTHLQKPSYLGKQASSVLRIATRNSEEVIVKLCAQHGTALICSSIKYDSHLSNRFTSRSLDKLVSRSVATEIVKNGTLKRHAPHSAYVTYNLFRKVEESLALPPSIHLTETCLTKPQDLLSMWKESPVAKFIAKSSDSIKKALNTQVAKKSIKYGVPGIGYGIDVYCAYDPKQESALQKALEDGTAVFTVGVIIRNAAEVGLAALGVTKSVLVPIIGLSVASSMAASNPRYDRPTKEVMKEAEKNLMKKFNNFGVFTGDDYVTTVLEHQFGRVLRWINPSFLLRQWQNLLQTKNDQEFFEQWKETTDVLTHESKISLLIEALKEHGIEVVSHPTETAHPRRQAVDNRSAPISDIPKDGNNNSTAENKFPHMPVKQDESIVSKELQHNDQFETDFRVHRDKPKPPRIDWNQLNFRAGVTPEGRVYLGPQVPINIGNYPMHASVHFEMDTQALKDLWTALRNKKGDPKNFKIPTDLGIYKVSWYRMGNSVCSSKYSSDFKVTIQDPDGKKHTMWVEGQHRIEKKVNAYINEIAHKKVTTEFNRFNEQFKSNLKNGDAIRAQEVLKGFFDTYKTYLQSDFIKPYQDTLDDIFAVERVDNLLNAPIETILDRITALEKQTIVTPAERMEHELLRKLLRSRLLIEKTEDRLQQATAIFSEQEIRAISISINTENFNQANAILRNAELSENERQKAFKERYDAAKHLLGRKLSEQDLEGDQSPAFVQATIDNYEWSEGSLRTSEAREAIQTILHPHIQVKENKAFINFHSFSDAELSELRKKADIIAQRAKPEGEAYLYSQYILRQNYQVFSESYGKFGSLFITGALSEFEDIKRVKAISGVLHVVDSLVPTLSQDLLTLSFSSLQGHGAAGLENAVQGIHHSLNQLKKSKLETMYRIIKAGISLLPLVVDSQKDQNRRVTQYTHAITQLLTRFHDYTTGTFALNLLTTTLTPFSLYEFFHSEQEFPKDKGEWTYIDFINDRFYSFFKGRIRPGNLPENAIYYFIKHVANNSAVAFTAVQLARKVTGPDESDRDIKAGVAYVVGMTALQGYTGKFDHERMFAMMKNISFFIKERQFLKAFPSITRLKEFVKPTSSNYESVKLVNTRIFCTESYLTCLYNISLTQQKQSGEDFLRELIDATEDGGGFDLAIADLNTILMNDGLVSLHSLATRVLNNIVELEKESLKLIIKQQISKSELEHETIVESEIPDLILSDEEDQL